MGFVQWGRGGCARCVGRGIRSGASPPPTGQVSTTSSPYSGGLYPPSPTNNTKKEEEISAIKILLPAAAARRRTDSTRALLLLTIEGWEITFQWVPSHTGIPSNEEADSAARMALTDVNTTPFPLSLSAAKCLISRLCRSTWNNTLGDTLRITSMGQYRSAVMMAEFCSIPTCSKQITSDRAEVHDKGLEGLLRASIEREDGLQSVFERKRSQLPETVIDYNVETKIPRNRRVRAHDALTKATLQSVIEKAGDRHDEWGDAVRLRISNELDFIAAEVKYHHDCQVLFYAGKQFPSENSRDGYQRGRPVNATKHAAFQKLCQFIRDNDDVIFTCRTYDFDGRLFRWRRGLQPQKARTEIGECFGQDIVRLVILENRPYTFLDESNTSLEVIMSPVT
ncbi:hypothetical protein GWK47_042018 [Chionoecetes opilio]|uniref:RNase H type-1 domain-containing protein n=1 Tax=Chionoecetes opilio TaxID=41210 RepID=A0A8J4YNF7_CHIOP|nr:hypothetical protein GWK47_042018 [Chionoecetes opilio]